MLMLPYPMILSTRPLAIYCYLTTLYSFVLFIYLFSMNFSFELEWAALTGNMSPEAMMWLSSVFGAFVGWLAIVRMAVWLGLAILMLISGWKVFKKAGLPGWAIFVPVYNMIVRLQVAKMSGRRLLTIVFPPVFVIVMIISCFKIAENFWKHWTFGLGILFLKFIFVPILAFDNSKFIGKKNTGVAAPKAAIAPTPFKKTLIKKPVVKKPVAKKTTPVASKKPTKPTKKVIKKK